MPYRWCTRCVCDWIGYLTLILSLFMRFTELFFGLWLLLLLSHFLSFFSSFIARFQFFIQFLFAHASVSFLYFTFHCIAAFVLVGWACMSYHIKITCWTNAMQYKVNMQDNTVYICNILDTTKYAILWSWLCSSLALSTIRQAKRVCELNWNTHTFTQSIK